jgi:hypothetical protein
MRLCRFLPLLPCCLAVTAWGELETAPGSTSTQEAAPSPAPALPSPLALLRQIDQGFVQVYEKVAPERGGDRRPEKAG